MFCLANILCETKRENEPCVIIKSYSIVLHETKSMLCEK